jgi:hypothetical protein
VINGESIRARERMTEYIEQVGRRVRSRPSPCTFKRDGGERAGLAMSKEEDKQRDVSAAVPTTSQGSSAVRSGCGAHCSQCCRSCGACRRAQIPMQLPDFRPLLLVYIGVTRLLQAEFLEFFFGTPELPSVSTKMNLYVKQNQD